jgi:hypothetical protein
MENRYFIDTIRVLNSELKNNKGHELYDECKDKFVHAVITEHGIQEVLSLLRSFCDFLNKKYPRMSQLEVILEEQKCSTDKDITVYWVGKKEVKDKCIKMHLIKVKEY